MPILETIVAGVVATSFMTLLMTFVHQAEWANADMIRALGSIATRSMQGAVKAGVIIHLVSGVCFAVPYTILLGILSPHGKGSPVLMGTVIGLLHGIIVSLILVAVVSNRHPVPKFRGAGLPVAAAHVFGHLGYGFGIGLMYGVLHISWA